MTDLRKRNDELLAALEAAHTREAIAERQLAELQQDFDALKAALAEALEALRPFAAMADEIESMAAQTHSTPDGWSKSCTWENLTRTRAFLAKYGGSNDRPQR